MTRSSASRLAIGGFIALTIGCGGDSTGELVEQLGHRDPQVRRAAIQALAEHGGDVSVIVPALEQTLADTDPGVRLAAAVAIQNVDPANRNIRPVLIESLEVGNAAMFLEVGRMGQEAARAVPTLVKQLSHPQPQIRALAARALGEIGVADDNVEAMLERRLRDDAPAVRKAARRALEQIQAPAADLNP